jgi:ADP-ribose pyrophosphatase
MKRPYRTLSSRIAWSSPWYRIRQDEIITPDGRPGVYNVVEKEAAVWIVPVLADGRLVLIKNYRYSVDDWCWEIPAGSVKPGQSLAEAACAELGEEIGGTAEEVTYINQFYTANGISSEVGHIFLATGVSLGTPNHEATEVMEIHPISIAEGLHLARSLQMRDAPSALALLVCEERLLAFKKFQE